MNPYFSVIIPTYNRKDFLKTAIDSVLAQTYSDFELIIVDDGSTDDTEKLVHGYSDSRINCIHQNNHGVAHARNRGIELAKGKYIAFLDSDDRWEPEKLTYTFDYIKGYPDISIFHTKEVWFRNKKFLKQKQIHQNPDGWVFDKILPICCISMSTIVIDKNAFGTIGIFDEDYEACEDYEFLLRATLEYEVKLIPKELTIKDGGRPDQLSSSVWGLDRFRVRALIKMIDSQKLSDTNLLLTRQELNKKCQILIQGAKKRGNAELEKQYEEIIQNYGTQETK